MLLGGAHICGSIFVGRLFEVGSVDGVLTGLSYVLLLAELGKGSVVVALVLAATGVERAARPVPEGGDLGDFVL